MKRFLGISVVAAMMLLAVAGLSAAQDTAVAKTEAAPADTACATATTAAAPAVTAEAAPATTAAPAIVAPAATATPAASAAPAAAPLPFNTTKERVSYAIGLNLGNNIKSSNVDIDPDLLAQGIKDTLAGSPKLTQDQIRDILMAFQKEMMAKQEQTMKDAADKNLKEGQAFLEENKKKEGVTVTASGLQYKVLTAGTGPMPKATDTVCVNYKGTLINGTEFDSSAKHGGPATFSLEGIIPGWKEALQLMPVGSKWLLVIPPALAYGDQPAGPQIGPNSTLVFEVELVKIEAAPGAEPADTAKGAATTAAPAPTADGAAATAEPAKPAATDAAK